MDFRQIVAALRNSWWALILGLLLGGLGAMAINLTSTPIYTSTAQLFVSTTESGSTSQALQGNQFAEQRIASYVALIANPEMDARVIRRLGLNMSPAELAGRVSAQAVQGTVVLEVTAKDTDPQRAQTIAQGVSEELITVVDELETPPDASAPPVKVTIFGAANLPRSPSSPRPVLNLAVGLTIGLLMGAAAAIARARLDRSVKDGGEAAELAGAPVIGTILRDDTLRKRHRIEANSSGATAEAYRQLQTNLQFLDVDNPPRVLMISSAVADEGKTTVAVNLALSLAEAGRRVVVIEADLRRPRVTQYLGLVAGTGLANLLTGAAELEDVAQRYADGNMVVIAAGPAVPNPVQLLSSAAMAGLLEKLRAAYDYVIIDAPPLLPVADAAGLAVLVDGVLLAVRYGRTGKHQLQRTRAALERVGASTAGVVLNIVPPRSDVAGAYGYEYGPSRPRATAG